MSSKESPRRKSFRSTEGAREASERPSAKRNSADVRLEENGVSLYVHLPWCTSKCRYCDFNSWAWRGNDLARTVDALIREAAERAPNLRPQTVFIGGGTPSLLPADELTRLLEGLHEHTRFRDTAVEVTMEANPESFDAATARSARDGGVDRLSLGVQSLRADVLEAYDRVHTGADALRAFHDARDAGFARINVDLIFAFPGQRLEEWESDLTQILALQPEHISCYELAYEPGTALTRLRDVGRWEPVEQDDALELFRRTEEICRAHGLHRYEVSAYARTGEESRHNLAYWRSLPHVGIGAGAVGWRDGERRRNRANPEEWADAVLGGDAVALCVETERPGAHTKLFDHLMMGLRLSEEGVLLERAVRQSGADPFEVYGRRLNASLDAGELEQFDLGDGPRLRMTPRGLEILDELLRDLAPAIEV